MEFEGLNEDQMKIIEKSRHRVIDSIGNNIDLYGITLSIGHLYGNMYFRNTPVTLDEMGETMGMSKTSMSTGMRTLLDSKMITKVWGKGSRKDLYEVEADWHKNFVDYFSIKWRKSMEMNQISLKKSLTELTKLREDHTDNSALVDIATNDINKMTSAINYYKWLGRLIDSFESGEIYNWVPKEDQQVD